MTDSVISWGLLCLGAGYGLVQLYKAFDAEMEAKKAETEKAWEELVAERQAYDFDELYEKRCKND